MTFALFGLMAVVTSRSVLPQEARALGWGFLLEHPAEAIPAALATLYQPVFMGILPLFVWCMLALPAFGWMLSRWADRALALPLLLYAAYRIWRIDLPSLDPGGGIAFQPLVWQLPFMLGAWAGRRALLRGTVVAWSGAPARWITWAAAALVLAAIALRLGWYGFAPWTPPFAETENWVGKEGLAPPRLLHALALAWLVAALVPREAGWMHRVLGRALAATGRHSLPVFCLGLFLSWGTSGAFRLLPAARWLDPLLMLTGCALLAGFARLLDQRRTSGAKPARPGISAA